MKKLLFLMLGVVWGLGVNSSAFAQVKIEKLEENIDLVPGKTYAGSILVENSSPQEVAVRAYLEDLQYTPPFSGARKAVLLGSTAYSIGKFVTVDTPFFKISPNGSQRVTYSIAAPKDAKGGYYGIIFFEKVPSSQDQGLGVVVRYGLKLLAESKDKTLDVKIEGAEPIRDGLVGNFYNDGDVILICEVSYAVIDVKGMVMDRGPVSKELSIPPQERAPFKAVLSEKIPAGDYTLVMDFKRSRSGVVTKEIDFSKDSAGNITIKNVKE